MTRCEGPILDCVVIVIYYSLSGIMSIWIASSILVFNLVKI
jgi:hypothetical protein